MMYEESWADEGREKTPRCRCGRWIGWASYKNGETQHILTLVDYGDGEEPVWEMRCPACRGSGPTEIVPDGVNLKDTWQYV